MGNMNRMEYDWCVFCMPVDVAHLPILFGSHSDSRPTAFKFVVYYVGENGYTIDDVT